MYFDHCISLLAFLPQHSLLHRPSASAAQLARSFQLHVPGSQAVAPRPAVSPNGLR